MCGLQGFSGKGEYSLDKIKFLMLWNSVERGKDATGIFTPDSGILKDNDPAAKFFIGKEIQKLKKDKTLIGHVRAKTVGFNTAKNAHPFEAGNIIMAHNGTLTFTHTLSSKYKMKAVDWDVDSQILAEALSQNYEEGKGKEENYKVLSEYEGAAALVFYNKDTENLYCWHDKERPLFYGWDEYGNMYISSIKESLEAISLFSVTEFEINTLYTIKDSQIVTTKKYKTYLELNPPIVTTRNCSNDKNVLKKTTTLEFPEIGDKQRGFTKETLKPYYLIGFNVRAKYTTSGGQSSNGPLASVVKNKFYLVTGYYANNSLVVQILDEDKKHRVCFTQALDIEDFFPKVGDLVVLVSDLERVRPPKINLWHKGDFVEIISVDDFANNDFSVLHEKSGVLYNLKGQSFRVTTEEDYEVFDNTNLQQLSEDNDKIEPVVEEGLVEDAEIISSEDDEYIDIRIFKGIMDRLKKEIDELEENYEIPGSDLTADINKINSTLNLSGDKSYLETFKNI